LEESEHAFTEFREPVVFGVVELIVSLVGGAEQIESVPEDLKCQLENFRVLKAKGASQEN